MSKIGHNLIDLKVNVDMIFSKNLNYLAGKEQVED